MEGKKTITGFSKLSKRGKIRWIVENFFKDPEVVMRELKSYWLSNEEEQKILDGFSENTISNYYLPYGVAPNFLINDKTYAVPMVIEESSVVAAASRASKFWLERGGIRTSVLSTLKVGHIHFYWDGDETELRASFDQLKSKIHESTEDITANMNKRGGGIREVQLITFKEEEKYYQIFIEFETCDSMGANFINSILERCAQNLEKWFLDTPSLSNYPPNIIMSILSNYTPKCVVRAEVSCSIEELGSFDNGNIPAEEFADRFAKAIRIAHIDPYRAATHNKGIFNGIDAVVLATGNDFRAIEAGGHAYAARSGQYRSLSDCTVTNDTFHFWLEIPMAIGTIGGLTSLHPIARRSLELLGSPDARELMQVIAATGLAQNFSAIRSLVTTGIQKGHMKMHLSNILNKLEATDEEVVATRLHFTDKVISFKEVNDFIADYRKGLFVHS